MKKLRLIKPWKLRTVKQRIENNVVKGGVDYMPCCGPSGNMLTSQCANAVLTILRIKMGEPYSSKGGVKAPR